MTSSGQRLLEVKGLTKFFPVVGSNDVIQAVNNVSFHLDRGETLGLVGESGSGKTTVGRCILRLIEPTDGTILFNGIEITQMKQDEFRRHRHRMQMVFQEPYDALNPRMSVYRIVEEPLTLQGRLGEKERRERVIYILNLVGLDIQHLKLFPHQISGGQQQRVGIARAIATSPELVLLDEPTSSLDISIRARIINLLMRLQHELGLAYIFISHDLLAVRHISHRTAIMYLGKIMEIGDTKSIFQEQLHPYSRALLSSVLYPDPDQVRSAFTLKGEIPSPRNPPSGCVLHTRCPLADERCRAETPILREIGAGRFVACLKA